MKTFMLALLILASQLSQLAEPPPTYIGEFTATEYCQECNTPRGSKTTASGRWEEGYSVATSEIALGTIIIVNGKEYRVDDTGCPRGRIDFLIDSKNGCNCNRKERIKVYEKVSN